MRCLRPLCVLAILLALSPSVRAMFELGGKSPVEDHNWPAGSVELANLPSRLAFWEGPPFGGGQFCFLYRGDTPAFTAAREKFARLKSPQLLLL